MPDDGLDQVDERAPCSADSGLAASIFVITSSFSVAVITAPSNQETNTMSTLTREHRQPQLSAVGRKTARYPMTGTAPTFVDSWG